MNLPRSHDMSRKADVFDMMLVHPIERLTERLRRGDPFDNDACNAIEKLIMRGDGLKAAYEHRCSLVEED